MEIASDETQKEISRLGKFVLWSMVSIIGFFLVTTYNENKESLKEISKQLNSIETRVIRMEYELKLKSN